jgi:hypothetical protein
MVPAVVQAALARDGQPLDQGIKAEMEARLGHDFSQVRIYTDALAARSADAVNARAYTVGSDIVFGAHQFAPATVIGKRLLAHELTHVLQQSHATAEPRLSAPSDAHEREARAAAIRVTASQPGILSANSSNVTSAAGGSPALVQRQGSDSDDELRLLTPQFTGLATSLTLPNLPRQAPQLRMPNLAVRPAPDIRPFSPGLVPRLRAPSVGNLGGPRATYFALPPLLPLQFTPDQLAALGARALPDNLRLSILAAGHDDGTGGASSAPATPASGSHEFPRGNTTLDVGADLSVGSQTAMEAYISLVLQSDLAQFHPRHVEIDVIHQPTAQILVGLNLGRRPADTPAAYHAAQISATLLNAHFNVFRHEIEVGLGQLAIGEQGGQGQATAGATVEGHINNKLSLMLTGVYTLTPGPKGWSAASGPFTVGLVWHGPAL